MFGRKIFSSFVALNFMICMYTLEHYVDHFFIFLESCIKTIEASSCLASCSNPPICWAIDASFLENSQKSGNRFGPKRTRGVKIGQKGSKIRRRAHSLLTWFIPGRPDCLASSACSLICIFYSTEQQVFRVIHLNLQHRQNRWLLVKFVKQCAV